MEGPSVIGEFRILRLFLFRLILGVILASKVTFAEESKALIDPDDVAYDIFLRHTPSASDTGPLFDHLRAFPFLREKFEETYLKGSRFTEPLKRGRTFREFYSQQLDADFKRGTLRFELATRPFRTPQKNRGFECLTLFKRSY